MLYMVECFYRPPSPSALLYLAFARDTLLQRKKSVREKTV